MVSRSITTVFTAALCASAALAAALEGRYVEAGLAAHEVRDSSSWPHGPFRTEGRDIVNARGDKIKWAGVNWPMSGETMVPEGLEKRSVEEILDEVASLGMNFLRMGYSAQMVDEEAESEGQADVPLEAAMIKALGYHNGTRVTGAIVKHNPRWTRTTGRFEIWSGIARLAAERGIYVHPDMHIATAGWCCGHDDGSAWFGDAGFSVGNWTRALGRVAEWAAGHPNVVSMSLVNELRRPWGSEGGKGSTDSDDEEKKNDPSRFEYNWLSLVGNMTLGADAVHAANPDLLISWSGLQFDEDLSALTSGLDLNSAPCYMCAAVRDAPRRQPKVFDLADHAWGDKVFYELHLYPMSEDLDVGTCGVIKAQLYRAGFNALGMPPPADCSLLETSPLGPCRPASRLTPVAMTEFGASQDETLLGNPYIECLREFTTENDVSWAVWALAGSYRIRSGAQGVDDGWALMNFGWDGWRFEDGIEQVWKPWVNETNATGKN